MPSALLIEDRLTEHELEMERTVDQHGVYLVIAERNIEVYKQRTPPTIDELRQAIGRHMLENAPFRAMPGVVFWVYESHRELKGEVTVQITYEEHDVLFIQEELRGIVAVTRLDQHGRIRLLSENDSKTVQQWINVVGYAA